MGVNCFVSELLTTSGVAKISPFVSATMNSKRCAKFGLSEYMFLIKFFVNSYLTCSDNLGGCDT